jgi:hypothetical protein
MANRTQDQATGKAFVFTQEQIEKVEKHPAGRSHCRRYSEIRLSVPDNRSIQIEGFTLFAWIGVPFRS